MNVTITEFLSVHNDPTKVKSLNSIPCRRKRGMVVELHAFGIRWM